MSLMPDGKSISVVLTTNNHVMFFTSFLYELPEGYISEIMALFTTILCFLRWVWGVKNVNMPP